MYIIVIVVLILDRYILTWYENNSINPVCIFMCDCKSKNNSQMENFNCLVSIFALQDHKKARDILLATKEKTTYLFLFYGLGGQRYYLSQIRREFI